MEGSRERERERKGREEKRNKKLCDKDGNIKRKFITLGVGQGS
jgi:hypothetical protein